MSLVFEQREICLAIGNYTFRLVEPKTSDLTSLPNVKGETELDRSLKILQKNLYYRLTKKPQDEFVKATLEEIKELPSGVIQKLSEKMQELTDGEFTVI